MAGSKRNKLKKVVSSPQTTSPPDQDDDDLMDDLLAHLDSKEKSTKSEHAVAQNEAQSKDRTEGSVKLSAKGRFRARQVHSLSLIYPLIPSLIH